MQAAGQQLPQIE